jgi:hypothetical protein
VPDLDVEGEQLIEQLEGKSGEPAPEPLPTAAPAPAAAD